MMMVGAPDKDEKLKKAACAPRLIRGNETEKLNRPMILALFGRPAVHHQRTTSKILVVRR